MPTLQYSQTGITSDVLEDINRRRRQRGEPAPYAPTISGMTEPETETAINRATAADEDPGDAVEKVREQAAFRTKVSDADQADQAAMARGQRRQRVITALGAIGHLFGSRENDSARQALMRQAMEANDPAQFQARIDQRAQAAREQEDAKRAEQVAMDERVLNEDYRRSMINSMETNARRRDFEMERRTESDSRLYDPTNPVAMQRREFLRRIMASAPEVARGFEGQDLDALGSADLRTLTDQMLRRIQQTPNRYRQADVDQLMRIAAQLDADEAGPVGPEPAVAAPAPAPTPVQGRRPRPQAGAPVNPAVTQAATVPQAAAPAPRRDRTVRQIMADRIMERRGRPPPSGYSADDLTPGEAEAIARQSEATGARGQMARIAGGIDTQSREAQFQQAGQTGVFTQRQIDQAAEVLAPMAVQRQQIARLARDIQGMSDEQFIAAMSGNALAQRLFGAEEFAAQFRALTNTQLRQQSGAAVTDSEARRFFEALSAGRLNSKAAFMAALARMDREIAANGNLLVNPELRAAWRAQRGGRR